MKETPKVKRMAVAVILVMGSMVMAGPAVASTRPEPRQTQTTQVVNQSRPSEREPEARRFCADNPDHVRCQVRTVEPNVRQLIWRLVNAGEWRQLFHLLQRLGII